MTAIAIMELIGVVAGLAATAFFLFGPQRRLSRHNRTLFAILLTAVLANAAIDLVEQTGSYRRLDLVEDYVDMLILFAWGIFIFSLFPESSATKKKEGDLRRVFTRQLTFVFSTLLVLNVFYSLSSFIKSRDTLATVTDFHGPALVSVVEMRSLSNNAIQESFAYVVSRESVEKNEFENYAQSFGEYAEAFRALGRLDQEDERDALAVYEAVLFSQSELVKRAHGLFVESETSGRVSIESFHDYETIIDDLDMQFERLEQLERSKYEKSQTNAALMLEEANFEIPILGGISIALCVGLFSLLSWSFVQYSAEQEFARQELAKSEMRQREANQSLRLRDHAFRVAIVPIVFTDLDGRITEANQAFAELFGFENTVQVVGQLNTDFHCEPISVAQINADILESGGFEGEVASSRIDGTPIEIQISATLLTDADGLPVGHMAAFMDVTPRRQVERALRDSEQHYRTLVESAPEAIVVLDVDKGRFVDFNESAIELFRLDREQLSKIGPAELSPEFQPDGSNSVQAAMDFVLRALDGEAQAFDWLYLDSDGNEIQCEVRLVRLSSSDRLVRGSVTNISERIALENALSRRALEAELLYQAVSMADETDSLDAALQKCVDIVCEMTAWQVGHAFVPSPSGALQLESTKIWHFSDEQRFAKFREVTERTRFVTGEGLPGRVWHTGEPDWIVNIEQDDNFPRNRRLDNLGVKGSFGFPVKVRGEIVAILEFYNERAVEKNETLLLLVRSVGEQVGRVIERIEAAEASRKHHELVAEELEKAKGELILKTRLAAVGQMSAQIAHEMRNPLGAVSNAVFYLKGRVPASEEKWSEYLSLIGGEVATCNRFIGELLDVTRGKIPNREIINFANVIDRVLARHSIPNSVEVQLVCQPDPFEIFADGDQLVQIIDNLIKNSLDAIAENAGRIEIRARRRGGNDTITIRDTGPGIEPEHRASVFDVLFTTKSTGTGLGLPICKQIIQRHGGTIELVDDSSPGTKFLVCLKHDPES